MSGGLALGVPFPHPAHGERARARDPPGSPSSGRDEPWTSRPGLGRGLARLDAWLVTQPGLVFMVVAALAALIGFHYL